MNNKRAAQAFLLRYLGADDVLYEFVREAQKTENPYHLDNFEKHIDSMESALSEVMDYAKLLKEDLNALRGRLAWERMNSPEKPVEQAT